MGKLPFGIASEPTVADTKAASVVISDHLGNSTLHVNTWWSGEGFTFSLEADDCRNDAIDLSWQEWAALKLAVKAIKDS